jgi:hypothetical protein
MWPPQGMPNPANVQVENSANHPKARAQNDPHTAPHGVDQETDKDRTNVVIFPTDDQ